MIDATDPIGRLEQRLGLVLKAGITFSAVALAAGLAVWLWRPGRAEAAWLLDTGLLAVTVTPLLRVVVSLAGYVRMRDWFFVATTAAVLLELAVAVGSALLRR
jgi:uncharacterized membrane protein